MRIAKSLIAGIVSLLAAASLPAQVSLTVNATMDIYRAGGYNDGSDGIAPVVYSFSARPLSVITFPSVGGAWTCSPPVPAYGADGTSLSSGCIPPSGKDMNPVGAFAGYHSTDFTGALVGMFLEDGLPASAPPSLRFYDTTSSLGGIPTYFRTLSPLIGQVFFIGDGLTGPGSGRLQEFQVPAPATHLYLGYIDSCNGGAVPGCYSDNEGSLSVAVKLQYRVPDWVEPTLSLAPSARGCASFVYDAAEVYSLFFGGGNGSARYGDTWIWRGGWTQLSPSSAPSARMATGTAYDASIGTVVLFGGADSNENPLGDTWIWDGVTWTQQFPPVSPPARDCSTQCMVYDPATQTVVLFGGYGAPNGDYGGVPFGDTWMWNGRTKTWTQIFPASSPSPRRAPLAYDSINKTVVLFGGDNGGGDCCNIYYNETWAWNGVTWTQEFPATSPPARTEHVMAYDASLGQVVVYGGYNIPGQGLDDTWAWNGRTWKQLSLAKQPGGRWGSSMDFEPLSSGLVLFGGEVTGDPFSNNTWLFVPVPVP